MPLRRRRSSGDRALGLAVGLVASVAPLLLGAVHPPVMLALSAAATLLGGLALSLRHDRLELSPWLVLFMLVPVVSLLQLVPWPPGLVALLSPEALSLRREAGAAGWVPLTLDGPGTLLALLFQLGCLGLFVAAQSAGRRAGQVARLLGPLVGVTLALALLFALQRMTGARTILGYEPKGVLGRGFAGTFVNQNHAASLFLLGALSAAGLALEAERPLWRALLGVTAAAGAVAVLATASRGGAVGLGIGAASFIGLMAYRRLHQRGQALGLALLFLAVLGALAFVAAEGLRSRLVEDTARVSLAESPKVRGWLDGVALAQRHPFTGAGTGAFESAVGPVRQRDLGVRLVYAENVLVQLFADLGIPVALAVLLLIGAGARRLMPRLGALEPSVLGAAAGIAGVAVHELADFGWAFPGVAFPTVAALGAVVGRASRIASRGGRTAGTQEQVSTDSVARQWRRRFVPLVAAGLLASALGPLGWRAAQQTLDQDTAESERLAKVVDAAPRAARGAPVVRTASEEALAVQLNEARLRHPASEVFVLQLARERLRQGELKQALPLLNRALVLHPGSWQAHRLAARTLAQLGRRSQAALEYRMAARSGFVAPREELLRLLGPAAVDAVEQTPTALFELSEWMVQHGEPKVALAAAVQATEVDPVGFGTAKRLYGLATALREEAPARVAAQSLGTLATHADEYVEAVRALAQSGLDAEATSVLTTGRRALPQEGSLLVLEAERAAARGDASRAKALLSELFSQTGQHSLRVQREGALLAAQLAQREGDVAAALQARFRARQLTIELEGAGGGR